MTEFFDILQQVPLFEDIDAAELVNMLDCLHARTARYKKGEYLLVAGDKPDTIGILLAGRLQVVRDGVDGQRALLATLTPPDIFAEALCCAGVAESPVSVLADTDATVLQLAFQRVLHTCPNACAHHQTLVANMMRLVAQKNLYLQSRLDLVSTKSVRARVLGYLNTFAAKRGKAFTIPLNRQEMADYLCVERSALSHELMRMKQQNLIDYQKNRFTLL